MFKCADCNVSFNDGVLCEGCNRRLDFACAHISEVGYRRLGTRRPAWRCRRCKASPFKQPTEGQQQPAEHQQQPAEPKQQPAEPKQQPAESQQQPAEPQQQPAEPRQQPAVTQQQDGASGSTNANEAAGVFDAGKFSTLMAELAIMKGQLACLPVLLADVRSIKDDIASLKSACEFNSSMLSDHATRLTEVEHNVSKLQGVGQLLDAARVEIEVLKGELEVKEQWSRLNNAEIKGVPVKKNENLFEVIDAVVTCTNLAVEMVQGAISTAQMASRPQDLPKKTLALATDLLAFPDKSKDSQREFSRAEVAGFDGKDGRPLYIIVSDHVYDITSMADLHPGGPQPLKEHAGQDATLAMKTSTMSPDVLGIYIQRFQVGTIKESERDTSSVAENLEGAVKSRIV